MARRAQLAGAPPLRWVGRLGVAVAWLTRAALATVAAAFYHRPSAELHHLTMPITVIWGERDRHIPLASIAPLREAHPTASHVAIIRERLADHRPSQRTPGGRPCDFQHSSNGR